VSTWAIHNSRPRDLLRALDIALEDIALGARPRYTDPKAFDLGIPIEAGGFAGDGPPEK
jgi:hypothetical protein